MPRPDKTPAYRFTLISKPGAASTIAHSINARGQIAGNYTDQAGVTHAFIETGGYFATIDVPGTVAGINDFGELVGNYYDGARSHAYADLNGTIIPIEVPGAANTTVFGLNNRGQIAGEYSDATGIHGFVETHGRFATIDFPGANDTHVRGINDRGQITGSYTLPTTGRQTYGFFDDNGAFNSINAPDSNGTFPLAINDPGQIVGTTAQHGFLESGGTFTNVDAPSAVRTIPTGINNSGLVTGVYEDANGKGNSFLATPRFAFATPFANAEDLSAGTQDLAQLLAVTDPTSLRDLLPSPGGIDVPQAGGAGAAGDLWDLLAVGAGGLSYLDPNNIGLAVLPRAAT